MHIILESANNGGKSSIIKELKENKYSVIHYGPPSGNNNIEKFNNECESIKTYCELLKTRDNIIFDRSAFGGSFLFGMLFRNYSFYQMHMIYETIKKYHPTDGYMYVILKKDIELLKKHYDGDFIKFEDIERDKFYYEVELPKILDSLNIRHIIFNVKDRTAEENAILLKQIIL